MNLRTAIAAALFALSPVAASACASVDVTVLPFVVAQDFTMLSSEILDSTGGVGQFGVVTVKFTATVSGCNVTVGYANPVLHVASELRRDACSFDHVMVHEEEHVRLYRAALATLAARIRGARLGA